MEEGNTYIVPRTTEAACHAPHRHNVMACDAQPQYQANLILDGWLELKKTKAPCYPRQRGPLVYPPLSLRNAPTS